MNATFVWEKVLQQINEAKKFKDTINKYEIYYNLLWFNDVYADMDVEQLNQLNRHLTSIILSNIEIGDECVYRLGRVNINIFLYNVKNLTCIDKIAQNNKKYCNISILDISEVKLFKSIEKTVNSLHADLLNKCSENVRNELNKTSRLKYIKIDLFKLAIYIYFIQCKKIGNKSIFIYSDVCKNSKINILELLVVAFYKGLEAVGMLNGFAPTTSSFQGENSFYIIYDTVDSVNPNQNVIYDMICNILYTTKKILKKMIPMLDVQENEISELEQIVFNILFTFQNIHIANILMTHKDMVKVLLREYSDELYNRLMAKMETGKMKFNRLYTEIANYYNVYLIGVFKKKKEKCKIFKTLKRNINVPLCARKSRFAMEPSSVEAFLKP